MRSSMNSVQAAACMPDRIVGSCIAAVPALAAEEEARVLILNGTDPYLPVLLEIDSAVGANLAREAARRIVLSSEVLDARRFPTEAFEPQLLGFLAKEYNGLRVDVVVAVSQRALEGSGDAARSGRIEVVVDQE
jgi:hypothetical protein